jgi:hypothetical protein
MSIAFPLMLMIDKTGLISFNSVEDFRPSLRQLRLAPEFCSVRPAVAGIQ